MWLQGVRQYVPIAVIVGLAVVIAGCPRKPPQPVKPAEAAPPQPAPTERPAVPPAPAPQPSVSEADEAKMKFQNAMRAFEGDLIHFDFDRSEIKDQYKPLLNQKADFLKEYSNVRIQIEGHADDRGSVQYNLALGDRRANSAKAYLTALGVDANRISTISFGEERPLEQGHDEAAWAKNRRAKFVVVGQ